MMRTHPRGGYGVWSVRKCGCCVAAIILVLFQICDVSDGFRAIVRREEGTRNDTVSASASAAAGAAGAAGAAATAEAAAASARAAGAAASAVVGVRKKRARACFSEVMTRPETDIRYDVSRCDPNSATSTGCIANLTIVEVKCHDDTEFILSTGNPPEKARLFAGIGTFVFFSVSSVFAVFVYLRFRRRQRLSADRLFKATAEELYRRPFNKRSSVVESLSRMNSMRKTQTSNGKESDRLMNSNIELNVSTRDIGPSSLDPSSIGPSSLGPPSTGQSSGNLLLIVHSPNTLHVNN